MLKPLMAVALIGLMPKCSPADAPDSKPTAEERAALAGLKGRVSGTIVWESNRTGQWELYTMNADGTGARRISALAKPGDARAYAAYLRPRFSPDGETILFAYGKKHAPAEAWVISAEGKNARKLTVGNPLNWSADGQAFFLVRDSILWRYDMATGRETKVSAAKVPADGLNGGMVGALRADMKSVVLRTPRRNEYFVLDQGKTVKTMGGCEPRFSPDGRYLYWVQGPKDFRVWDTQTGKEHQILGVPPVEPYNYTYCPTVSPDAHWLLYGASPGQHSHDTSDYEVYIQELRDWKAIGKPVRLTFNKGTDRWPFLFIGAQTLAQRVPGPIDVLTFDSKDAGPGFGGEWGLWPQVDGCGAEETFLPGQDAQGGKGGAMRLDYDIRGEPKSFSLWSTPAAGSLDLSRHGRFVIYARGIVPSFTLVVKDAAATDPDAPDGIADALVSGVSALWKRFDVPFASFKPRKRGAKVDWTTINHVGIALIQPQNQARGRLEIDNLRVLVADAPKRKPVAAGAKQPQSTRALYTFKDGLRDTSGTDAGLDLAPGKGTAPVVGDGRVSFRAPGIVSSAKPASSIIAGCRATNEITIEAWLKPDNASQGGPARIVTLSADPSQRDFTLGQDKDRYSVRLRTTGTSINGIPSLDSPGGLAGPTPAYVVYTRDAAGRARLYVNAREVAAADVPGNLSNWAVDQRLALGNELTMDRPWLGDIYYVAIHDTALSAVQIEERYKAQKSSLKLPADARSSLPDGRIVWETNRSGTFQLWLMKLDGSDKHPITSGDEPNTGAQFSADGTRIIFTRGTSNKIPSVWIMNADGSAPRKLIDNASDPRWHKGDTVIQFHRQPKRGRDFWQTWEYDLASKQERLLFPVEGVAYKPQLWEARGNDDGTRFVAWSPRPRGTWILSADGKTQIHVHSGCEGQIAPGQRYGYGVKTAGQFIRFNLSDGGDPVIFNKRSGEWSHTYFPCVSEDGKWLIYGACPPDQHSHNTSDYEVFLVRLDNWSTAGDPIRLTFHKATDRWPRMHIGAGE